MNLVLEPEVCGFGTLEFRDTFPRSTTMVDPTPQRKVGNHLDVVHDVRGGSESSRSGPDGTPGNPRPFLGIQFRCCQTYGRIYRNDQRTAYRGGCPKCGARVEVPIGSGGTSKRFFSAG